MNVELLAEKPRQIALKLWQAVLDGNSFVPFCSTEKCANAVARVNNTWAEAVITGAAGNFGAVCARMMAAEGAKLALVDLVEDKPTSQ